MKESLKSLFTRLEALEEQNVLFKLENQQLKAANKHDIKQLREENERVFPALIQPWSSAWSDWKPSRASYRPP